MDLASHLGMSLQRVMRETTVSELLDWKVYLDRKVKQLSDAELTHSKQDWYLAQIAMEVRRTTARRGVILRLKDFLLKFSRGQAAQTPVLTKEEQTKYAKRKWLNWAGLSDKE